VIELLETVGPLTDPAAHGGRAEDAFHLVLPSLPGYGFAGEPRELGWNVGRIATAWAELMRRLGYSRYVAQGGDVGASVTDAMGRKAPAGLLGIHMNLLVTVLAGPQPTETEQERAAADTLAAFRASGFGYFLEQATRPHTIGYALLDSPVALAAWMLDHDTDAYYKISRAFVDDQPSGNLTRDHILDNITLYWLTGTAALGGPVLLGERTSTSCRGRGRADASRGQDPGRLHHVPRRDLADSPHLGRELVPDPHLRQRGRQRRPLRRLGGARAVHHRGSRDVPLAPLNRGRTHNTREVVLSSTVQQAPGIRRIDLQQHDLSVAGREVIQNRVEIAPEAPFIRHKHPGEEIIYVLEGSLEYHIDGAEPKTVNAGEALMVPAETVHAVKNVGSGDAAELATYVVEKGKPFLVIVE
jgi:quercetin dioxygenase-like cupin family protein